MELKKSIKSTIKVTEMQANKCIELYASRDDNIQSGYHVGSTSEKSAITMANIEAILF